MSGTIMHQLLAEASKRAASYLDALPARDVAPLPGAVTRLTEALADPLPGGPSSPAEVLTFLDDYGSPATVASAGGRYFGFVTGGALPATPAAPYLAAAWDRSEERRGGKECVGTGTSRWSPCH